MSTQKEHSPLPWRYEKDEDGTRHIYSAKPRDVSLFCDENYYPWCSPIDADWQLIVHRVNTYDDLLAVLKLLWQETRTPATRDDNPYLWSVLDAVSAAIAKAEGF